MDVTLDLPAIGVDKPSIGAGKVNAALQALADALAGLSKADVGLDQVENVDTVQRANHEGFQPSSTISDLAETVRGLLATTFVEGTGVTIAVNDAGDRITLSSQASTSIATLSDVDLDVAAIPATITLALNPITGEWVQGQVGPDVALPYITLTGPDGLLQGYIDGDGQWAVRSAAPGASRPNPPVLSVAAGDTTVSATWPAVVGATYYQVEQNGIAVGPPITGTSLVIPGLTNGTAYTFTVLAVNSAGPSSPSNAVTVTPATIVTSTPLVAVDCGGVAHGNWSGDTAASPSPYLTEGDPSSAYTNPGAVSGTSDQELYESERWFPGGLGEFTIPVPNGNYTVHGFWAEQFAGVTAAGGRVMNVSLQGSVVDASLDVYALVGANTALERTYTASVTDGTLILQVAFVLGQSPHLCAFDVTPIAVTSAPDPVVLNTPTVGVASGQVGLTWTPSATATSYQVYRGGTTAVGGPITATSLLVSGLTNGTSYSFTVKPINIEGTGAASNAQSAIPSAPVAPSANRGVDATWTPSTYDILVAPGQLTQAFINARPAGYTYALAAGYHRLSSTLMFHAGDSVLCFPGAIISGGTDISVGWTSDGAGRWSHPGLPAGSFPGWTLPDPGVSPNTTPILIDNTFGRDVQDLIVDKAFLQPVGAKPAAGNTANFWFDHSANVMWIGFDPTAHLIETPAFSFNRNTQTAGYIGLISGTGLTLKNAVVEIGGGGWNPLVYQPSGGSIDHCLIRLCHTQGVAGFGGSLTNSIVTHNGQLGLSGAITTVTNVEFSYNNELHFNTQWEAGGGKYANETANTIHTNCWYHHNYAPGWWYDFAGAGNKHITCTFEDNQYNGIMVEMTPSGVLDRCIFRRNGLIGNTWTAYYIHWWVYLVGVALQHSDAWEVKGCYSYDNVGGPWLGWTDNGRVTDSDVGTPTTNHNVHDNVFGFINTPNNNVVYDSGLTNMLHNQKAGWLSDTITPSGNVETNNVYYAETGSAGSTATWFVFATTSQTLTQWKAAGRGVGDTITDGAVPAVPGGVGSGD